MNKYGIGRPMKLYLSVRAHQNSTFFPNMDINMEICEDSQKDVSVKKSASFVKNSSCDSIFKF